MMANRGRVNAAPNQYSRGKRALVLIFLSALLSACTQPDPAPLRVGILVWPGYEMAFLARDRGFYEGHPIELVEFHSPALSLDAYNNRSIDLMALTTHYALQLAARDPSQRIILLTNISHGADVLLARPEIGAISELAGLRIGVERSALGAYMLQRILETASLAPSDIQIVSVDVSDGPEYYERDLVDAIVTYEPYRTAIGSLGARELFSSREMPDEIMDVLITREAIIESHDTALAALIDGWLRAVDLFQTSPREFAPPLARREGLSMEEFLKTFDDVLLADRAANKKWLRAGAMAERLEFTAAVLRRAEFLDAELDYPSLLDGRFIHPEALP